MSSLFERLPEMLEEECIAPDKRASNVLEELLKRLNVMDQWVPKESPTVSDRGEWEDFQATFTGFLSRHEMPLEDHENWAHALELVGSWVDEQIPTAA